MGVTSTLLLMRIRDVFFEGGVLRIGAMELLLHRYSDLSESISVLIGHLKIENRSCVTDISDRRALLFDYLHSLRHQRGI